MKACTMVGCDRTFSERSRSDVCPVCRASMYQWQKRTPADVMRRRTNLNKYTGRLDYVTGDSGSRKALTQKQLKEKLYEQD